MFDCNSIIINNKDDKQYAYEKAIEAYWKHVDRYHTWMNYYAIFNGALFVGFCTLLTATTTIEPHLDRYLSLSLTNTYSNLQLLVCLIGFISSICWALSIVGHESWEKNWMNIIEYYEMQQALNPRVYTMLCTPRNKIKAKINNDGIIEDGYLIKGLSTHFATKVFIFCVIIGWLILTTNSIIDIFSLNINMLISILLLIGSVFLLGIVFNLTLGFGHAHSNIIGKFWQEKKKRSMENTHTLASMFEVNKQALEKDLVGLTLPKDANKIQNVVSKYLNTMFENDGVYRQHLTQAEDYILQAALGLLNAQQNIAHEISNPKAEAVSSQKSEKKNINPYTSLIGTTVGGALGAFGGTWGAVFGAIAGTAVVLYCATAMPRPQTQTVSTDKQIAKPTIRTEVFLEIVKNICESIDNLIETFRTQIKRVENVYEQKEKPSLQKDYSLLLTSIQELVVASNTACEDREKKLNRLEKKVNDLAESLENYGVAIVDGKITNLKE